MKPLWLVVAAGIIGCSDAVTDPDAIGAIDFTGVPFPAVVTGDTLRNTAGVASPLVATVYNGRGEVIAAPVAYFSLDTGVAVDVSGYLTATRRDGPVRLVASVNGLQSQVRLVQVTREPDSVLAPTTEIDYTYAIPDRAANVTPAIALTVTSSDTAGGLGAGVAGWLVRWRIVHAGDTLAVTDTTKVALWSAAGTRHSLLDTTKTDGLSSRRLRIYANLIPPQPDSFFVIAEVKSRGAHLPGSPVRYVIRIAPPVIAP
jgi:hypothetical protein